MAINENYCDDSDEVQTVYSNAPRRTLHPHSEAAYSFKVNNGGGSGPLMGSRATVLSAKNNLNRSSNNLYGGVRASYSFFLIL